MDFSWTEEQQQLRSSIEAFASRELADVPRAGGGFPRAAWQRCADVGIQGLHVPRELGGQGADALTTMYALEGLGHACRDNGLIFSLNAQMWACQHPIVQFGSDHQRARYLPSLCDGSLIGAHATTEAEAGSDALSLRTKATRDGAGYRLDGSKAFVTNGPEAGVFVVLATTDATKGIGGLTAFLVDRDATGLHVGPALAKMGLESSPIGELSLDGCHVPEEARLGRLGGGLAVFTSAMEWERTFILAGAVGTMERQLERSVAHARSRRQFGRPIADFQSVSNRLVDMKARLEASRLLLYRAAWLKGNGQRVGFDAALAKLHVSESFVETSLDALQVHGGYGYLTGDEYERDVRDALAGRIYSGTSDMQRSIIARHLGL